jgi:hypothetical protein
MLAGIGVTLKSASLCVSGSDAGSMVMNVVLLR